MSLLKLCLLLTLVVGVLSFASLSEQEEQQLRSAGFQKAQEAGCIARFNGGATDTRVTRAGACPDSDKVRDWTSSCTPTPLVPTCSPHNIVCCCCCQFREVAVVWPHCEGEKCAGE